MKKRSTKRDSVSAVMGLDLGDRVSRYCVVAGVDGETVDEGRVPTTPRRLERLLVGGERLRVVIEVGTHSPWVSRLIQQLGHEVVVANPRRLRLITAHARKSDRMDAELLARLGRVDVALLSPVEHRSRRQQCDLAVIRSRDALVRARTLLINQVRGTVKALGERLPSCSAASFARRVPEALPEDLRAALAPVVAQIGALTESIAGLERTIKKRIETTYPAAQRLLSVPGVGPITALSFVLTLGRAERFGKSRTVGAYLGLVPRRAQSGDREPQLRITKHGDPFLRRLLVQCAHYILGRFGPDSDLRRAGLRIAERGGDNAKKRAVVAVARKLAVALHRMWVSGEAYQPFHRTGHPARRQVA